MPGCYNQDMVDNVEHILKTLDLIISWYEYSTIGTTTPAKQATRFFSHISYTRRYFSSWEDRHKIVHPLVLVSSRFSSINCAFQHIVALFCYCYRCIVKLITSPPPSWSWMMQTVYMMVRNCIRLVLNNDRSQSWEYDPYIIHGFLYHWPCNVVPVVTLDQPLLWKA